MRPYRKGEGRETLYDCLPASRWICPGAVRVRRSQQGLAEKNPRAPGGEKNPCPLTHLGKNYSNEGARQQSAMIRAHVTTRACGGH
jgi:hypothetical protein